MFLVLAGFAEGGAAIASTAPVPADVRQWHFEVLLDAKPIGEHVFTVARRANEEVIDSQAHFRVTALFVPLYRYDHRDHESWHGGCLDKLDARTQDNGHASAVSGHLTGQSFVVRSPHGETTLPGCVKSFAYWDESFLVEHRLLNPQTGEYDPIEVSRLGPASITVRGQGVPAEHYRVTASQLRIDLWYSPAGEWLALESRTKEAHTLRYELR